MNDLKEKIISMLDNKEFISQIRPTDPAVNPTTKKNANSVKSLGIEFTIRLN